MTMTSERLGDEYIKSEIEKIEQRISLYKEIYAMSPVSCLTLNRLIATKETELRLLKSLA